MSVPALFNCRKHQNLTTTDRAKNFELCNKYLTVVEANSKELLDDVFRLRFQVYCVERGFENAAEYPEGRERDQDDARSAHFLVLYRGTGSPLATAAGTVRFILPRPGLDLPVLRLIEAAERRLVNLPFDSTAEVSRFAVAKAFRKRLENELSGAVTRTGGEDGHPRARFPVLTFGLLRAVVMMSVHGGITHIVAMMEPALLRLLARLGIEFNSIGKRVEHHGERQPVWAAMANIVERVRRHHPELWEFATNAGRQLPIQRPLVGSDQISAIGAVAGRARRAMAAAYGH
jgi:N-acyl amino acid synthase of PEP-CTERM/exosortase system